MKERNDSGSAEREKQPLTDRRGFLQGISVACASVVAAIISIPPVAFILGPGFRKERRVWQKIGPRDAFQVGETVAVDFENAAAMEWAGVAARRVAWLRREAEDEFIAFAVNCTHLGCPVQWEPKANLFLCPCHGGIYYSNGDVAGGPPPRPLERYPVRIRGDQVEIQTGPVLAA